VDEGSNLGIEGVELISLTAHEDGRGSLTEVFRRDWIPSAGAMIQANLSISNGGVLRGMHFHRAQTDYWCLLAGSAFVGLYDLREGSPTVATKAEIRLTADLGRQALLIPPGVAHGFYAETDLMLAYFVDRYFDGQDEFGVMWNDPNVGIAWPARNPELSERDRSNPLLAEVRSRATSFGT
jgi:dTDP-4-dehydrorhamnose 3,5-epimerase